MYLRCVHLCTALHKHLHTYICNVSRYVKNDYWVNSRPLKYEVYKRTLQFHTVHQCGGAHFLPLSSKAKNLAKSSRDLQRTPDFFFFICCCRCQLLCGGPFENITVHLKRVKQSTPRSLRRTKNDIIGPHTNGGA